MKDVKIFAFADEAGASFDGQISAMKRNNIDGLEIRGVDGENISDISFSKAKEVKKKLDAADLICWSIGSPIGKINITDNFDKHLEKFQYTLEIANILNSQNMRIFSFYIPENKVKTDYKNEVIDRLGKLGELANKVSVNLCHENEKGIYGDTAESCLELFKELKFLKGIFDPANFVQCSEDTLKAWEMLKDNIYYMHIKDAKANGSVVPAGYGDGNIKQIVNSFVSMGGKDFTIEPHLTVFEGLKNLEREGETSKIEFSYLDSNVAFDTACKAFKKILEE